MSKWPFVVIFNLILYRLHSGCRWSALPCSVQGSSWQAVYYHFRKWSADGNLEGVWVESIVQVRGALDVTCLNLDGTHTLAKKGGEGVAYQRRKRGRTSNLLVMVDAHGYMLAASPLIAGNHHDAFQLDAHLKTFIHALKRLQLPIHRVYLNTDSDFDSKALRRRCFNHQLIPNIAPNSRNQKVTRRGRKRLFNPDVYKQRFCIERTFAWLDKFRALLIRLDRSDTLFLAAFQLAFALFNLRHLFNSKV